MTAPRTRSVKNLPPLLLPLAAFGGAAALAPDSSLLRIVASVVLPIVLGLSLHIASDVRRDRPTSVRWATAALVVITAGVAVPAAAVPLVQAGLAAGMGVFEALCLPVMTIPMFIVAVLLEAPSTKTSSEVGGVPAPVRVVERVVEKAVERVVEVPGPREFIDRPVMPNGEPTDVYRLLDADGGLLYVGISVDAKQRLRGHAAEKSWWNEVARHETRQYPYRAQALAVEHSTIAYERPRYNRNRGGLHDSGSTDPVFGNWTGKSKRVDFPLPKAPAGSPAAIAMEDA